MSKNSNFRRQVRYFTPLCCEPDCFCSNCNIIPLGEENVSFLSVISLHCFSSHASFFNSSGLRVLCSSLHHAFLNDQQGWMHFLNFTQQTSLASHCIISPIIHPTLHNYYYGKSIAEITEIKEFSSVEREEVFFQFCYFLFQSSPPSSLPA